MDTQWLEKISPHLRTHPLCTWHGPVRSGFVESPRVIYNHEVIFVGKGKYLFDIEGEKVVSPQHAYIIIPPGKTWGMWSIGGRGYLYGTHFDWVWQGPHPNSPVMTIYPARPIPELYRRAPNFVPEGILHGTIASPQRVFDLMEKLYTMYSGSAHDKTLGRAVLMEIMLEILDPSVRDMPAYEKETQLTE